MFSTGLHLLIGKLEKDDEGYFVQDRHRKIRISINLINEETEWLWSKEMKTDSRWYYKCIDYFDDTDNQYRIIANSSAPI